MFSNFIFRCFGFSSSSKDTGTYDLGELDQALFLYFDGQDPSGVQEQRRECFLSQNFLLSSYKGTFIFSLVFCWEDSFGNGLFGSQEKHVQQIKIFHASTFFDQILTCRTKALKRLFKNMFSTFKYEERILLISFLSPCLELVFWNMTCNKTNPLIMIFLRFLHVLKRVRKGYGLSLPFSPLFLPFSVFMAES